MKLKKYMVALILMSSIHPTCEAAAAMMNLYASPSATSAGSGLSPDEPTSLKKVQLLAQEKAKSGYAVTVNLEGGRYELDRTMKFGPVDSGSERAPVIYKGVSSEKVIFSGGAEIKDWKQVQGNLYSAPLPRTLSNFRQLYTEKNGTNLPRPIRASSDQMGQIDEWDVDSQGSFLVSGAEWNSKKQNFDSNYPELVVRRFWIESYVRIKSIRPQGQDRYLVTTVSLDGQRERGKPSPNKEYGQPCYFTNEAGLLNRENEWYLDTNARTIYFRFPRGDRSDVHVFAPKLEHIIEIDGAENLTFENINFQESNWLEPSENGLTGVQASYFQRSLQSDDWFPMTAGVVAKNTLNLKFIKDVFKNMGAAGLELTQGTHHTLIEGNRFTEIAGTGVQVYTNIGKLHGSVDGIDGHNVNDNMNPPVEDRSSYDVISNNYVDHVGLDYTGSIGIFATYPEYLTVSHNEVYNVAYTGISIGWGWTSLDSALKGNKIIGNNVHHVMEKLDDGGGIYLLSKQPRTIIMQNYVHEMHSSATAGRRPVVPIYLDNNVQRTTVSQNVCANFSGDNQTSSGIFYRPETGATNSIEPCARENRAVTSNAGPTSEFQVMKNTQ